MTGEVGGELISGGEEPDAESDESAKPEDEANEGNNDDDDASHQSLAWELGLVSQGKGRGEASGPHRGDRVNCRRITGVQFASYWRTEPEYTVLPGMLILAPLFTPDHGTSARQRSFPKSLC